MYHSFSYSGASEVQLPLRLHNVGILQPLKFSSLLKSVAFGIQEPLRCAAFEIHSLRTFSAYEFCLSSNGDQQQSVVTTLIHCRNSNVLDFFYSSSWVRIQLCLVDIMIFYYVILTCVNTDDVTLMCDTYYASSFISKPIVCEYPAHRLKLSCSTAVTHLHSNIFKLSWNAIV